MKKYWWMVPISISVLVGLIAVGIQYLNNRNADTRELEQTLEIFKDQIKSHQEASAQLEKAVAQQLTTVIILEQHVIAEDRRALGSRSIDRLTERIQASIEERQAIVEHLRKMRVVLIYPEDTEIPDHTPSNQGQWKKLSGVVLR